MLLAALTGCEIISGTNDGELFTGVSHAYGAAVESGSSGEFSGVTDNGGISAGEVGMVSDGVNSGVSVSVAAAVSGEILGIAKKYYEYHSGALSGDLKGEFSREVGAVSFDGKSADWEHAEKLCTTAAAVAMLEGDGDYAVGCAAAAVGWSQEYARSAGTLAAMLETAGFVADKDRLNDAAKLAAYAITVDGSDADFYVTLGRVLYAQNDLDGALEAVEAALAIEPGNSAALNLKIEILNKKGGTFLSAAAQKIGKELEDSDGELSKRLTEQEKAVEGIGDPKEGDSKEEALRKLRVLYELEPITPADMMESISATQAGQLREKILTVTDDQKNLGWPEFPGMLAKDNETLKTGGYDIYNEWYLKQIDLKWETYYAIREIPGLKKVVDYTARYAYGIETSADYMLAYNEQIVEAARECYVNIVRSYVDEYSDIADAQSTKIDQVWDTANDTYSADIAAGVPSDVAALKRNLTINNAINETHTLMLGLNQAKYLELRREGELLWEKMLPFARCTEEPAYVTANLYETIASLGILYSIDLLYSNGHVWYTPGISEHDLIDLEAAKEEAYKEQIRNPNPLEGFTLSYEFGPFEFKLSSNKVEIEYVNGSACKVSYDWKSKEMEFGVGVGHKAKLGMVKGAQVGVEAKAYVNFVVDLRKNEITDIYLSAEAKGSAGSYEAGGQAKVSLMGKGAGLSTAAKKKFGSFAIEHEAVIIKTE